MNVNFAKTDRITAIMAFLFFLSAICWAGGNKETNTTSTSTAYFTGSGGSGMRLGILVPQSQGLNESQAYLPSLIQGVLVSNISKYSAISVLDRVALDRVIGETLDPTYEDNLEIVRLGHVAQVGYMMTGKITRTGSGYSLQINVTDTTPNANTIASYSSTCTTNQLDDHSAIHRASTELLTQMGVQLTASAKKELERASSTQDRNAQTALAQGIVAQRHGQTVEAISYFLNASSFESVSTEALNRMSLATTTITTGSLGTQIRNDIQQRNEWVKLINETNNFFIDNPQYAVAELYYNSSLNLSSINYEGGKALLTFPMQVKLNDEKANAVNKIISDIQNGLNATGKKEQWGIDVNLDPFAYHYSFVFELLNNRGKVISEAKLFTVLFRIQKKIGFYLLYDDLPNYKSRYTNYNGGFTYHFKPYLSPYSFLELDGSNGSYSIRIDDTPLPFEIVGSVSDSYINQNSKRGEAGIYSFFNVRFAYRLNEFKSLVKWAHEPTFIVRAEDITDTLSIRLKEISVYQYKYINKQKKYDYVPIKKGINIIPVHINEINDY